MTKILPINCCYSCYMCKHMGNKLDANGESVRCCRCLYSDKYMELLLSDSIPDFCKLKELIE